MTLTLHGLITQLLLTSFPRLNRFSAVIIWSMRCKARGDGWIQSRGFSLVTPALKNLPKENFTFVSWGRCRTAIHFVLNEANTHTNMICVLERLIKDKRVYLHKENLLGILEVNLI